MTWIILAAALLILGYNGGMLIYRLGRRDEARELRQEMEQWRWRFIRSFRQDLGTIFGCPIETDAGLPPDIVEFRSGRDKVRIINLRNE